MRSLVLTVLLTICLISTLNFNNFVPKIMEKDNSYEVMREKLVADDHAGRSDNAVRHALDANEVSLMLKMKLFALKDIQSFIDMHPQNLHPAQADIVYIRQFLQSHPGHLWEMIKSMPKGALLHGHFDAIGDMRWLVKYSTYLDECYLNSETLADTQVGLEFSLSLHTMDSPFVKVSQLRQSFSQGVDAFDDLLYRRLTLIDTIGNGVDNISDALLWHRFINTFTGAGSLLRYTKILKAFMKEKIKSLIADGVMYIEERIPVKTLLLRSHTNASQIIDEYEAVRIIQETVKSAIQDFDANEKFLGYKLILTGLKVPSTLSVEHSMSKAIELKQAFPDIICGFDLVGYEDVGMSLHDTLPEIQWFQQECRRLNINLPFVWHAGETVSIDNNSDQNLYDAILTGSKRIGHGLSLVKHPHLQQVVKERNIAIELCPISNKVLKYTPFDLRLHPLIPLLNNGVSIVLAPDDPAIFGVGEFPSSYDFWMISMAWSSVDLATLKYLAMNSIEHSLNDEDLKVSMLKTFKQSWTEWINKWDNPVLN